MPLHEKEKRLAELEAKWLNGTITPEEEREYAQWYNEDDGAAIIIPPKTAANELEHKTKLLEHIAGKTYNRKAPVRRILLRSSAAAVLLLLIGAVVYKYVMPAKETSHAIAENIDVLPGKDKAVLTLSNGQQVELSGQQKIKDGDIDINNKNGELVYSTAGKKPNTIQHNTMTTPNGGKYKINLPDGTQVWLNAASSISYPTVFTGNARKVRVTGEVYFDVAKNGNAPFIVDVDGQLEVTVLGTAFNVNAYRNEENVLATLINGKVKVVKGNESVVLVPGDQSAVRNGKLQVANSVDIEKIIAWKENKFVFEGDKLSAILRQLERWYDVEVVYEGKLSDELFSGVISRNKNVSEVFKMLQQAGNVKYRIAGRKIFVQP
jgi:transmembrane sensor